MAKLTARAVQTRKIPGSYGDGGGLYLQVSGPSGTDAVSLAKPREKAIEARPLLVAGTDPSRHAAKPESFGLYPVEGER